MIVVLAKNQGTIILMRLRGQAWLTCRSKREKWPEKAGGAFHSTKNPGKFRFPVPLCRKFWKFLSETERNGSVHPGWHNQPEIFRIYCPIWHAKFSKCQKGIFCRMESAPDESHSSGIIFLPRFFGATCFAQENHMHLEGRAMQCLLDRR